MNLLIQSTGIDIVPVLQAELTRLSPTLVCHPWPTDVACDYAIVWKPPAELFARQPNLKAIFNYGAGADAILSMGVVPPHLPIIRLEDAGMAQQIAEFALYGVLTHQRKMATYLAQQRAAHWEQHEDRGNVVTPTVGVMGLGEMGGHVAKKLAQFGYPTSGWSRSQHVIEGVHCYAGEATLSEFLSQSQVLVCVLPLTESTQGILNARLFSQLPKGAYLVSAGRGAHMVDADVLGALESGQLSGALLDVFPEEPLGKTSPFWSHPKVIVTPHIAGTTPVKDACLQIVDKLERLARGEAVSGIIDRQRGY